MSQTLHESIPKAVGPYRHAVEANGLVFVSGQIPVDPKTNNLVTDNIRDATRQCLKNLTAVLGDVGLELRDVAKTTIYLADIKTFGEMNEAYAEFFNDPYPARACVQVAALPKGAAVEIDAIAVRKSGGTR